MKLLYVPGMPNGLYSAIFCLGGLCLTVVVTLTGMELHTSILSAFPVEVNMARCLRFGGFSNTSVESSFYVKC